MSELLKRIRSWWWPQQRTQDLLILWPVCKANAPTLDHAKAAFAVHAFNDPAWYAHYGEQLPDIIEALK